jgi:hypothetical protein
MPDRKPRRTPRLVLGVLLLALAFGGCGGTTEVVKTVTVDRPVNVDPDPAPSTPSKSRKERRSEAQPAPAAPSEYVSCDANIEVKAATTTCAFAQNTFWHYWTSGASDAIQVYSAAAGSAFDVSCTVRGSHVACSTTDGGEVRFSQAALDLYSQTQADTYAGSHDLGPDPYESLASPDPAPSAPQPLYETGGGNIPNYENGNGYRVQCNDGMYSQSGGIQGACSGHGGVAE